MADRRFSTPDPRMTFSRAEIKALFEAQRASLRQLGEENPWYPTERVATAIAEADASERWYDSLTDDELAAHLADANDPRTQLNRLEREFAQMQRRLYELQRDGHLDAEQAKEFNRLMNEAWRGVGEPLRAEVWG